MYRTIRTALGSYVFLIILIVPIVSTSLYKKTADLPHVMARHWARFTLACADSGVEVIGQENIPTGPVIYMANHSSFFDVLTILGNLDVQFKWIVKKELFRLPFFGLAMKRCGYISVDRDNHRKALESIDLAAERVRSGTSVFIFPEGTRSMDGTLRYPFKKGGFHLALRSGVPIVPMTIIGSRDILPKDGMVIKQGNIKLIIGKPIYPGRHNVESLMEESFRSINQLLSSRPDSGPEALSAAIA